VRERKAIEKRNSTQFAAVCEALLDRGANVRFRAQGQSMKPNILNNDAVIVAPAKQSELRRGDVAFTQTENGFRAHRVSDCFSSAGNVITRGDAGQEDDPSTQTMLGKVVAIERNGQRTSITRPGQRFRHAFRTQINRLKLAASLRLKKFASTLAVFGFLLAAGILLNASPAASTSRRRPIPRCRALRLTRTGIARTPEQPVPSSVSTPPHWPAALTPLRTPFCSR
jgi:hypothetical protein